MPPIARPLFSFLRLPRPAAGPDHSPLPLRLRRLSLGLLLLGLAACSPRQLIVGNLADELAAQGAASENDLELARDAAPFYLKLSESVLAQQPGHAGLSEALAANFTQYAYAFVAFEADRVEAQDAAAASRLRQRAARLYARARQHAVNALEARYSGFATALRSSNPAQWPRLAAADAGLAYWGAAAWASWISLSKDAPEIVADLPLAIRLAELAHRADPQWGDGAMPGLRATLEASRPGGDRAQARRWFDEAIALSAGRSAAPLLAKAEGDALPAGRREEFEALLKAALAVPRVANDPLALQNEVMRRRAAWLLEQVPDLF